LVASARASKGIDQACQVVVSGRQSDRAVAARKARNKATTTRKWARTGRHDGRAREASAVEPLDLHRKRIDRYNRVLNAVVEPDVARYEDERANSFNGPEIRFRPEPAAPQRTSSAA
jgi:hypothetical protein